MTATFPQMADYSNAHHLANPREMHECGQELGKIAKPGQVIALIGDLGAGKTTLSQGIVSGIGYTDHVTSPTFSLMQEYLGGRLEVYHFDFYRVNHEHELIELAWDEILERGGLVIVEWPALYPHLLPADTIWLELRHTERGEGRTIQQVAAPHT